MTKFKVGDQAVYPGFGVVTIDRLVNNKSSSHYVCKTVNGNLDIIIPVEAANSIGLRNIISEKDLDKVFQILKVKKLSASFTWNRRYREYLEKVKTGSIYEIAEVFRDLFIIQKSKDLSFGERKMLHLVKELLFSEVAIATKTNIDKAECYIKKLLA